MTPRFKRVVIEDFSGYEAGRSSNGGAYGFRQTYTPDGPGTYTVRHWTTADFQYCEYCGAWGECGCGDIPQSITEAELLGLIANAEQDRSEGISVEVEPNDDPDYFRTIRRRIEDALRKTAKPEDLIRIAGMLGVKTE